MSKPAFLSKIRSFRAYAITHSFGCICTFEFRQGSIFRANRINNSSSTRNFTFASATYPNTAIFCKTCLVLNTLSGHFLSEANKHNNVLLTLCFFGHKKKIQPYECSIKSFAAKALTLRQCTKNTKTVLTTSNMA